MQNLIFRGNPLPMSQIKNSINKLSYTIKGDLNKDNSLSCKEIIKALSLLSEEIKETNREISKYISKSNITNKIKKELNLYPKEIVNENIENNIFKGYLPLGVVGHIFFLNDTYTSFTSIINSLVCGNINIILLSKVNSHPLIKLINRLLDLEPKLQSYIYVFPLEHLEKENLITTLNTCNTVNVLGTDSNKTEAKNLISNNIKIHFLDKKIHFTYVTKSSINDKIYPSIIKDYLKYNNLNTNVIYYECDTKKDLLLFAENLLKEVNELPKFIDDNYSLPLLAPIPKIDTTKKNKSILENKNNEYKIILDTDSAFNISSNKTDIILKGIKRKDILKTFIQYSLFIDCVTLECSMNELYELTSLLSSCGVNKITSSGLLSIEDHIKLKDYSREFSLQIESLPKGIFNFEELNTDNSSEFNKLPIAPKEVIEDISYHKEYFEKSKIRKGYSLISSGLNPNTDICINILPNIESFNDSIINYEILNKLNAHQIVIKENENLQYVANEIINCNGNVLIGSSKYIIDLLNSNKDAILLYGKITKIFYNGDNFSLEELNYLKKDFNIKIIKKFNYGSNNYGTLGISCEKCSDNIYHVNLPYKNLEIFKFDYDEPVIGSEIGRIVWNIKTPNGEEIIKYESGELGQWIDKTCECGRNTPLFKIVGEKGDLFTLCQTKINYNDIKDILSEKLSYNGLIQINLETIDNWTSMTILLEKYFNINEGYKVLYENSPAIKYTLDNNLASITLINMDVSEFVYSNEKVIKVIDDRK